MSLTPCFTTPRIEHCLFGGLSSSCYSRKYWSHTSRLLVACQTKTALVLPVVTSTTWKSCIKLKCTPTHFLGLNPDFSHPTQLQKDCFSKHALRSQRSAGKPARPKHRLFYLLNWLNWLFAWLMALPKPLAVLDQVRATSWESAGLTPDLLTWLVCTSLRWTSAPPFLRLPPERASLEVLFRRRRC